MIIWGESNITLKQTLKSDSRNVSVRIFFWSGLVFSNFPLLEFQSSNDAFTTSKHAKSDWTSAPFSTHDLCCNLTPKPWEPWETAIKFSKETSAKITQKTPFNSPRRHLRKSPKKQLNSPRRHLQKSPKNSLTQDFDGVSHFHRRAVGGRDLADVVPGILRPDVLELQPDASGPGVAGGSGVKAIPAIPGGQETSGAQNLVAFSPHDNVISWNKWTRIRTSWDNELKLVKLSI